MDWLRYFHFSLSDLRGLVSRRTVILAVMAVFIFQGVGIFYKTLALQLIRMRPAPAVEIKAPAAAVAAREPVDAYRVIPERNLFGTTTKAVADKQTAAARSRTSRSSSTSRAPSPARGNMVSRSLKKRGRGSSVS